MRTNRKQAAFCGLFQFIEKVFRAAARMK